MNSSVYHKKLRLGLLYGIIAGLAFAIFAFGIDAASLALAHSTYFWIKLFPALLICITSGGLVGWLTIHFGTHGKAILMWGLLAIMYAWLVIWLPLTYAPSVISKLDPGLARWFDFNPIQSLIQFRAFSLFIVGLAAIICGLLEINLVQQALLASHGSSAVVTLLVCALAFSLAGSATDQIINNNLRQPVVVLNDLIQYAIDNQGNDIPVQKARQMHLSVLDPLDGMISKPRQLTLISFDQDLGLMNTLINFEGTLIKCSTVYAQPTVCIFIPPNP